jgi:hypothetical protein
LALCRTKDEADDHAHRCGRKDKISHVRGATGTDWRERGTYCRPSWRPS